MRRRFQRCRRVAYNDHEYGKYYKNVQQLRDGINKTINCAKTLYELSNSYIHKTK